MIKKQLYAAPATEVLELTLESSVLNNVSVNFGSSPEDRFDTSEQDW